LQLPLERLQVAYPSLVDELLKVASVLNRSVYLGRQVLGDVDRETATAGTAIKGVA